MPMVQACNTLLCALLKMGRIDMVWSVYEEIVSCLYL